MLRESNEIQCLLRDGAVKHIYFIAETKGSLSSLDLRRIEEIKTECARKIFKGCGCWQPNRTLRQSVDVR